MAATRALRAVSLGSIAAVATLGGCAMSPGSGLSALEAQAGLYAVLDETQELLEGEWVNHDDPTARGCVIPLWLDGELYPALRLGSAPAFPEVAMEDVRVAWLASGYTVEQTQVGDVTELQGRNSVNELLIFRVSADAMTLQGESECRPESAAERAQ